MNDGILINQDICDAILTHRVLAYVVKATGEARVVEPHAYGVTHDGRHALWSWRWTAKESGPNVEGGWELVRLDEMRDVQILAATFQGSRQGYRRGNKQMRLIHAQL